MPGENLISEIVLSFAAYIGCMLSITTGAFFLLRHGSGRAPAVWRATFCIGSAVVCIGGFLGMVAWRQ